MDIPSSVLQAVGKRGPRKGRAPFHDGVFALRVDGLSIRRFHANRAALQGLQKGQLRDCHLGSALEMVDMAYLPLAALDGCFDGRGEVDI